MALAVDLQDVGQRITHQRTLVVDAVLEPIPRNSGSTSASCHCGRTTEVNNFPKGVWQIGDLKLKKP